MSLRSPYFTPSPSGPSSTAMSEGSKLMRRSTRKRKLPLDGVDSSLLLDESAGSNTSAMAVPATPQSLPRRSSRSRRPKDEGFPARSASPSEGMQGSHKRKRRDKAMVVTPKTGLPPSPVSPTKQEKAVKTVIAPSEKGNIENVGKIMLIQERVRHDPWKMLVATTLLNVTSGRAARPVLIEILRRWPTPQELANADMDELIEVLYPIGLFIQRANSLSLLSKQYLEWGWPIIPQSSASPVLKSGNHKPKRKKKSKPTKLQASEIPSAEDLEKSKAEIKPHNPYEDPLPSLPLPIPPNLPAELDVKIFRGAGRYASDSFRIYSHLLPGKGGPDQEPRWLEKRERAVARLKAARKPRRQSSLETAEDGEEDGFEVEELGEHLSDEESVGEEEWRNVRALDKELRRYLIWRWGLEGIVYNIDKGPIIKRKRDRKRLDLN